MISYRNELEAMFDVYEKELFLTENEIKERCNKLIKEHKFDRDYMFDLNDVLYFRGYSFQYDIPELDRKAFSEYEYSEVVENATKSKIKTEKLISYLNDINDFRLSFCTLHALKTKYLIELGILPKDNEYINSNLNLNLRDLIFQIYESKPSDRDAIVECLDKVGIPYSTLDYMLFRLDMEYVLWTIEKKDKTKGYLKSNTIKVALNIAPTSFFERNGKCYYDSDFSKKINTYLKSADKNAVLFVKNEWCNIIENIDDTGYKLLFKIL